MTLILDFLFVLFLNYRIGALQIGLVNRNFRHTGGALERRGGIVRERRRGAEGFVVRLGGGGRQGCGGAASAGGGRGDVGVSDLADGVITEGGTGVL